MAPRADYGKIGELKQKEAETASDFLDRLHSVFRQHSGLTYEEGPETPYQQQLKNAFLNGLLPPVNSHVEKHWVTMNIGSLPDALQYAEHACRVIKKKHENVGTFTVDPETDLLHFQENIEDRCKDEGEEIEEGAEEVTKAEEITDQNVTTGTEIIPVGNVERKDTFLETVDQGKIEKVEMKID